MINIFKENKRLKKEIVELSEKNYELAKKLKDIIK